MCESFMGFLLLKRKDMTPSRGKAIESKAGMTVQAEREGKRVPLVPGLPFGVF